MRYNPNPATAAAPQSTIRRATAPAGTPAQGEASVPRYQGNRGGNGRREKVMLIPDVDPNGSAEVYANFAQAVLVDVIDETSGEVVGQQFDFRLLGQGVAVDMLPEQPLTGNGEIVAQKNAGSNDFGRDLYELGMSMEPGERRLVGVSRNEDGEQLVEEGCVYLQLYRVKPKEVHATVHTDVNPYRSTKLKLS